MYIYIYIYIYLCIYKKYQNTSNYYILSISTNTKQLYFQTQILLTDKKYHHGSNRYWLPHMQTPSWITSKENSYTHLSRHFHLYTSGL